MMATMQEIFVQMIYPQPNPIVALLLISAYFAIRSFFRPKILHIKTHDLVIHSKGNSSLLILIFTYILKRKR